MKKLVAFTLAEVLITLAIIGVVAALTIPTLVTSYQKKMYVTQLKKSYNNLSNGFKTLMAQDGVTKLSDTTLWSKIPVDGSGYGYFDSREINEPESKPFFDEFKKTFKVSAAYGEGKLPEKYKILLKYLDNSGTEEADFSIFLADGSWLYFELNKNPSFAMCNEHDCVSLSEFQQVNNTKTKFWSWVGFLYIDVNGLKGPNIAGRDIFVFFLGNDGVLYPYGGVDYAVYDGCSQDNLENCSSYWKNENGDKACNLNSDGGGCAGRIMEEGWKMTY